MTPAEKLAERIEKKLIAKQWKDFLKRMEKKDALIND